MKKVGLMGLALSLMYSTAVNAADVQVRKIDVSGLQRVELETVLSYINIQKNENVSQEELDDALKRLYNTGLFADVVMDVSANGNLNIRLLENPIVNKRVFDGNEKIDDEMLEKEVQLAPRSVFSKAKVQRILEIYKRSGRYAAVVDPKVIVRSENRVDLIYEIDEGPIASISKINFIGNTHYSDDDLQSEIMSKETRWFRIFSSKENYDAEKTNYDKELLRRFYLKHGYADFAVSSAVAELSPDKKSFVITYVLDEGPRYKIGDISIKSQISEVDVKPMYKEVLIEQGDWYNAQKIEKTVTVLTEELGKKGFAFVDVEPQLVRHTASGKIDVIFNINEGERIFVDRINISGNTRTHDEVIRREFRIEEGDAFNAAKIKASRRNVENLNYFSKVDIETVPTDNNKADVNVNVEEKSTGSFNVGVGYSTVNGALVRAGINEDNFQGKGQQLGADVSVSQRSQDYDLSFTEPYFIESRRGFVPQRAGLSG